MKPMKPFDKALAKMRAICLALPDTKETPTWGEPHFRVGEKIFAGLGREKNGLICFKLEKEHAAALVESGRFRPAPYVGQHGWVSIDADDVANWDELTVLMLESYRLIAPRKTWAKVEGTKRPAASRKARTAPRRRA